MALRLVPFNQMWVTHHKLDLKGIYRRPRFTANDMDEIVQVFEDGVPQWDIVGPLPIKQHNKFLAKGFEFITLADRTSLNTAAKFGTLPAGTSARDFDQHQTGGPWYYKLYAQGQVTMDTAAAQQLRADVERFGADAVEELRRRDNPNFRLPPDLRSLGRPAPVAGEIPELPKRRGRPRKQPDPAGAAA